jgi:hypothetical protein
VSIRRTDRRALGRHARFHLPLDRPQGLPAHRVGRLWKFNASKVDEWVRAGGADEEKKQD